MESLLIHVGIGQLRVARNPARLLCVGLGSCVAIALYDPSNKIGGMAHIMLPHEMAGRTSESMPAKFGDTAPKKLLGEMVSVGANPYVVIAKIVGGANMFKNVSPEMKDIGHENVEAVKEGLIRNHVKIIAEDIGGTIGRTVELDTSTGRLLIRNIHGRSRSL
ncbi:MAG: chemotaxis protein CheD [Thermoplasmata archaeon]|nr:chemotaxis protein CheD [Thermoplasmata archaeon]